MDGQKKNIILIGFMGSGKTTTGISLSYKLQCALADTDKMIERQEGRSISDIFASEGEEGFREKETELLKNLKKNAHRQIYSVGGGTPLREENRRLLGKLGIVVYLKASPETVYERLKGDVSRPLLQVKDPLEEIQTLLRKREELYLEAADIVVCVDEKKPAQVVKEIMEALRQKGEEV